MNLCKTLTFEKNSVCHLVMELSEQLWSCLTPFCLQQCTSAEFYLWENFIHFPCKINKISLTLNICYKNLEICINLTVKISKAESVII